MPEDQKAFTLQVESSYPFDLYIKKGTSMVPDPANFDGLFKQEKSVILHNFSFDTQGGFIIAVYTHHADSAQLQIQVEE